MTLCKLYLQNIVSMENEKCSKKKKILIGSFFESWV